MNRREFILAGAAAASWVGCAAPRPLPRLGDVMTVRGPIHPDQMGFTLPHEHVLVDFRPITDQAPNSYSRLDVIEQVLPYLEEVRALGVQTVVDATPDFLGRDPRLLRALADRSGLHILTPTGYYGARDDVHLPDLVFEASPEEIAEQWISEWELGIGDTGIRPGFIKIGVDPGALSDVDAALVRAAALAHKATGLTIASHTGPAGPAFESLEILREEAVHPSAWIWVHAQSEDDWDAHVDAARAGAWVELDGVGPETIGRHTEMVRYMKRHGQLDRVLLSQDAGWYEPGTGIASFRPYSTIVTGLIPALLAAGLSEEEIAQLTIRNPAEAFRIRARIERPPSTSRRDAGWR